MKQSEKLKETIEEERKKLDELTLGGDLDATYRQSLLLDRLIEEYLELQTV